MAVDLAGNVYVTGAGSSLIVKIDGSTQQQTILASNESFPFTIGVDGAGTVYYRVNFQIKAVPVAFIGPRQLSEPITAGADSLPPVIPPGIPFTAQSDQDWLTVTSVAGGVVNFAFTADSSNQLRIGHIGLLGQSVTITQGVYLLGASTMVVDQNAGSTGVTLGVAAPNAPWTATTSVPWLHLGPGSASGAGDAFIQFTYDSNLSAALRTCTIAFNGGAFALSITQAGSGYVPFSASLSTLLTQPLFKNIVNLAPDPSGNLYIVTSDGTLARWNSATQQETTLISGLQSPFGGLAVDREGQVYIGDSANSTVQEWSPSTGKLTTLFSVKTGGIAVDTAGNLYILDLANNAIDKWTAAAQQLSTLVSGLNTPRSVTVDGSGNLYIVAGDLTTNKILLKWTAATQQLTTVATGLMGGNDAVADIAGHVYYIVDPLSTPGSAFVQMLGLSFSGFATGLIGPGNLAVDGAGNLYIPTVQLNQDGTQQSQVLTTRLGYAGPASVSEPQNAGSDALLPVVPSGIPFIAQSDQPWLSIQSTVNGIVRFTFTANNTGVPRTGNISVNQAVITVTQAAGQVNTQTSQVILFGPLANRNLNTPPFNIVATATSGLQVTLTSSTPAVCAIAGNTVTLAANGTCTIQAAQSGNAAYSPAPAVIQSFSVIAAQGPQPYITSYAQRRLRNDFTGWVGLEFITGALPLSVSSLGRIYVSGNSGTHIVKLVRGDGTDVPGGSVSLTMNGSAFFFQYAALPAPVVLKPRTTYILVSQEQQGGDQWFDYDRITTTSAATSQGPVFANNVYNLVVVQQPPDYAFIGPNMLYTALANTPPPSVSITFPAPGALVSGKSVVVSATAGAAPGLQISRVTFKIDTNTIIGSTVLSPPYQTTLDTTTLPDGPHTLTAIATDENNVSTTSAPVQIAISNGAAQSAGTALITGAVFERVRNNYTGFVGMKFTVGATPLTVGALGRIYVAGNTGIHTLKLVDAAAGLDVPGGSTVVDMVGGTPFQFKFSALASPVVLAANTTYFLMSQEVFGGDQWYDYSRVTNSGVVGGIVPAYGIAAPFVQVNSPNYSYVPVNLLYTMGAGPAGSPFIQQQTFGPVRNNFTGYAGMEFTITGTPVTVTQLGRICVGGNTGAHAMKLVKSDGTDLPGGSATVQMTGCTAGTYVYAPLPSPIALSANASYYLVSFEVAGGDQWYNYGPVTPSAAGSVNGPVYFSGGDYVLLALPGYAYVPVNFLTQ